MNTFAYVAALLAKTQTAFLLANAGGVNIPDAIPEAVSKLQKVVNAATGFDLPDSTTNDIADVEKVITSGFFHTDPKVQTVIGDLATLVANKGQFNATFTFTPKPTFSISAPDTTGPQS